MSSKGKEAMPVPDCKKAKSTPNELVTVLARPAAPGESTSTNPMVALGPKFTMLRSAATVEKILEACIPPFNKEEVSKLFHIFE